jgi:xylulokinase
MKFIGIDIGTTGCKASLFDQDGNELSSDYIEYSLNVISSSQIEQNALDWWNNTVLSVRRILQKSNTNKKEVKGISISSQSITVVPVDKDCNPLCAAISWLDTRAAKQTRELLERYCQKEIFQLTGKRINAAYTLPKLMWLKENKPEIFFKAYKFLLPHDFIYAKLTGKFYTDHTLSSGTLMYNIKDQCWHNNILENYQIDIGQLPEIAWSGSHVEPLWKQAQTELGLSDDVMVAVGGQDQKVAAFGVKLTIGNGTISLGTAGAIEIFTESILLDKDRCIPCFSYLNKGEWVLEAVIPTVGASIKWLRNTLYEKFSYEELTVQAAKSPIGSNGLLYFPHLAGTGSPQWKSDTMGMYYGISLSTKSEDFVRANFEGIAYQIKENIDRIKTLGLQVRELAVFGGGSRSNVWCDIIANTTGVKVSSYLASDIAILGAGKLAAIGCGIDVQEFGRSTLDKKNIYSPSMEASALYEGSYIDYQRLQNKYY